MAAGTLSACRSRVSRLTGVLLGVALAQAASAEAVLCPSEKVTVEAPEALTERICRDAETAILELASCELTVPTPLDISVVPDLGENCLGLYHCGERHIDVLPPEAYGSLLPPENPFSAVSRDGFFASVVRHEMAHAALDTLSCPFETCIVAEEYVAYTMQVMFLPSEDLARFESRIAYVPPISRDALNPAILFMAPEIFVQKAWLHLQDRPDPCSFIGQVARGEVLLDFERP
jgi:hypothetical protein